MRHALLSLISLCLASPVLAAPTPEAKCQAAKTRASGAYARCLQDAAAKLVLLGDTAKYEQTVGRCAAALASAFAKAEAVAGKKGASCPTSGDAGALDARIAADAEIAAASLASGGALPACGDGVVNGVGEQCDQLDLGGASCATFGLPPDGTLACDASCRFDPAACEGTCGDGEVNAVGEQCDLADLAGASCATLGHATGVLACDASCRYDAVACEDCEGGLFRDGGCWFMANVGLASCDDVCAARGRTCNEARTRAAGSDGTAQACHALVVALAPVAAPNTSMDLDWAACSPADVGMGCAYFPPDVLVPASPTYADRVTAPATTCSAIAGSPPCLRESLRVCACD